MSEETKDLVPAVQQAAGLYRGEPGSYFQALPADDPLNRVIAFSKYIRGARFIPADYRDDEKAIAFIVQRGFELQLPWTVALQSLYMTPQGKLGTQGDAIAAMLFSKGFKLSFPVNTREGATCRIIRPDGQEHTEEFTMEDADIVISRKDGQVKKLKDKDNWKNYPKNMLKWRALVNFARFIATDVISGVYLIDELEDIPDSTMGDTTDSDRQRMEQLQATEDKYKVKLKDPPQEAKPEPKQDAKPVVVEAKSEPVAETAKAEPAKAQPAEILYEIYRMFPTGNGELKPLPCEGEEPQKDKTAAGLRAQALANGSGMEHRIVKLENGERTDAMRAYPPEKKTTAPTPAQTTPAPAAEPAKPAADKPAEKAGDKPVSPAIARLNALATQLGIPGKTASTRFVAFMSGYAGCTPKEWKDQAEAAKMAALEELEAICAHDANEFNSGPEEAGKRRRQWADAIRQYLTNLWKDEAAVNLGCKLARQWGLSPDHWQKWVSSEANELDFKPLEDVRAILRVLLRTRQAASLIKLAKTHSLSLANIVEQIDKRALDGATIETASAAAVEAGVARFISDYSDYLRKQAQPDKAAEASPKPEPATVTAEGAAESDNLFGDQTW